MHKDALERAGQTKCNWSAFADGHKGMAVD
jgi:hypothetical protein